MTADEVRFAQKLFIDDCAGLKCIEVAHVHNRVTLVKRCVIKSPLWQAPNQRHLAAFEPEPDAPARTRLLTFGPLPAGFSVSRTFATTEAFNTVTRTGARPQIMKPPHVQRSSPRARWRHCCTQAISQAHRECQQLPQQLAHRRRR